MNLPEQGVAAILALVQERTGMRFSVGRTGILGQRLRARMEVLGLEGWPEYLQRVSTDPGEMAALVEAVTINETSFFRHPEQFEFLIRRDLVTRAARAREQGRVVRLWSAACASGCEAYSLVIACLEVERLHGAFRWEVIGSDIDRGALELARRGVYRRREVEAFLPAELRARYLLEEDGKSLRPGRELVGSVDFRLVNLIDGVYPEDCDVVLLRNVLYYLTREHRERVLRRAGAVLSDDGILLVAPTDTLWDVSVPLRVREGSPRVLTRGGETVRVRAGVAWTPIAVPAVPVSRGATPGSLAGKPAPVPSSSPRPSGRPLALTPTVCPDPLPRSTPEGASVIRFPALADEHSLEELRMAFRAVIERVGGGLPGDLVLDFRHCRALVPDVLLLITRALRALGGEVPVVIRDASDPVQRALMALVPGTPQLTWCAGRARVGEAERG